MSNKMRSKLKHDLQEVTYWLKAVCEGLSKEDVDEDIKTLVEESEKRLAEIVDNLLDEED